jgi:hypothetical protein
VVDVPPPVVVAMDPDQHVARRVEDERRVDDRHPRLDDLGAHHPGRPGPRHPPADDEAVDDDLLRRDDDATEPQVPPITMASTATRAPAITAPAAAAPTAAKPVVALVARFGVALVVASVGVSWGGDSAGGRALVRRGPARATTSNRSEPFQPSPQCVVWQPLQGVGQ